MEEETLKELIKEMELRVVSFEYNRDLNTEVDNTVIGMAKG
jgi:hypothetical protein